MNAPAFFARAFGSAGLRVVGALFVLTICVLSLIPGSWQARTGLPGPLEHVIAYLGTALTLGVGARSGRHLGRILVLLSVLAGGLEIAQHWSPGRDPAIVDWVAGTLGAAVGLGIAFGLRRGAIAWRQTRNGDQV